MDKIILGRREGKTTELIKRSAETFASIVCHTMDECSRIQEMAQKMGLDIPFPLCYDEFLGERYHAKGIKGFLIDNVEMLLQQLSPSVEIKSITLSP